ncbi:uncharacterized protein C12orf50 homolog [Theristicus caerulescens]
MVLFTISENCFLLQQKYRNIRCYWETQPMGCMRISCAFHHSKPRQINGLFLPPSNNAPLQQGVQEGVLHPAHRQESLRNQENILRPIHPPLIINLKDEEDDDDDPEEDEETYVSNWVPKTAADIEEERAIKEICYKSGEYYRIQYPHEHQSTKTASSPRENEPLPLEATERDLQKGNTTFLFVFSLLGIHASDPKGKPSHQQRGQNKHDETASSTPSVKETGRKTAFDSTEPQRSAYVVYPTVTQEPKFNGSTGDGNTTPTKFKNTKREGASSGRRAPIESIPGTDRTSFESGGIHASVPKGKPSHQQRGQSKHDETASSMPSVRETGRKTYFDSSEPRRSAYVVYPTVTQEPKFSGSTAVPEPHGGKCSKQKNQLDTNRRFWTQTENYDKYTSGSHSAPTWRKRNPPAKTFSKVKTTIQVTVGQKFLQLGLFSKSDMSLPT